MKRKQFKYALITGASMNLGKAFALECAGRGMGLVLVALPKQGLADLAKEIEAQKGVPVTIIEGDLTDPKTFTTIGEVLKSKSISVDLLVNNAGIGFVGPFMNRPLAESEATVNVNIMGFMRLTHLIVEAAPEGKNLQILNVASLGAAFPMPTMAVYSATKSFVLSLSLALRTELARKAGVSTLCPNTIRTTQAVKEYIEKFGLLAQLACLTPERIAHEAVDGASRNKDIIIPGRFNRLLNAAGAIVPRKLAMKAIQGAWGGFEEKETK